jgi:hypothetical protein
MNINVDELSDFISSEIKLYTDEIQDSMNKAADIVTKELVQDIKEDSPTNQGNYKKGWTRKKLKNSRVVYNKTDGWKTHLLEYCHAKKSGGRVEGIPHIKDNGKRAEERFEDLCIAIVSEGLKL